MSYETMVAGAPDQKFDRFRSRRLAVVEIEHSTQPPAALDDPVIVNSGRILSVANY